MTEGRENTETIGEGVRLPAPFSPLSAGTLVGGRFEIVRQIGFGGSSIVYEALDRTLGARIALKILRADRATPAALKRLLREAKIAREAQDSRLVRVWDIGEAPEGAFISMELVEGESLRAAIARGPLAIAEGIRIATEVLAALESLHARGVIHRDLKPSNVLLTSDGGVKLVDFGLARHWEGDESRATQTDALVGTVEYLSPEQALGKSLDPRTDLYSFGVLLFEMLTAAVPFRSESTLGAVLAHVHERAPDVRKLRSDVPRWLARVVALLLEKRPGDRYATAAQVLEDLGRGRARLQIARRTWVAAALTGALLLGGGTAWQLTRPKFASVARSPNGIEALDADGTILWRFGGRDAFAAVVRRDGSPVDVAVIERAEGASVPSVSLYDPDTGRLRRTIRLPDASEYFPGYPADFFPNSLDSVDTNHDGRHELIATLVHRYWPSYAVLIDPFDATARVVLVASGAHMFVGATDLDGAGGDELIFAGINNPMGWYGSLIATRVREEADGAEALLLPAGTLDNVSSSVAEQDVVWYELLPQGFLLRGAWEIDRARGTIVIPLTGSRTVETDLHGFIRGTRSALPLDGRLDARRRAFELARAARRSRALGELDRSLVELDAARALARAAGSPYLLESLDRSHAATLVKQGAFEEAVTEFELLARRSESPGDICWDAGKAFHLAGDLDRARAWYERGLASSGAAGRFKNDIIEAGMLAYAAGGDFRAARDFVDRAIRAHPGNEVVRPLFESFLQWQEGRRPSVPPLPGGHPGDFSRALYLEIRNAAGDPPSEVLTRMDAMGPFSELRPLASSLRADLLRRGGDAQAAAELARQALEEATIRGADDPVLAYFLPLIRQRFESAVAAQQP